MKATEKSADRDAGAGALRAGAKHNRGLILNTAMAAFLRDGINRISRDAGVGRSSSGHRTDPHLPDPCHHHWRISRARPHRGAASLCEQVQDYETPPEVIAKIPYYGDLAHGPAADPPNPIRISGEPHA